MTSDKIPTFVRFISGNQFNLKHPDWLTLQFDLPNGNLSIVLRSFVGGWTKPYFAAIDEILVTEGECPKEG